MRIRILKNWRLSLTVIIVAVFANWLIIDAHTQAESDYSRDSYGQVSDAIVAYHTTINEKFNDYMDILLSGEGDVEFDEDCPEGNISTYCLAQDVVDELIKFQFGLDDHAQYITDVDTETTNLGEITDEMALRQDMITLERQVAFDTLDLALAMYNEFQMMYPLHQEYEGLIETLELYNEKLAEWRKVIYEWPGDFIDVSTNKCK